MILSSGKVGTLEQFIVICGLNQVKLSDVGYEDEAHDAWFIPIFVDVHKNVFCRDWEHELIEKKLTDKVFIYEGNSVAPTAQASEAKELEKRELEFYGRAQDGK